MKTIVIIFLIALSSLAFSQNSFIRTYGDEGFTYAKGIIPLKDNGFILIGNRGSINGHSQIWIVKIDSSGTIKKEKYLGLEENTNANHIKNIGDTAFLICGMQKSEMDYQLYATLMDTSLQVMWEKRFGSSDNWEWGNESFIDPSGQIFIVGKKLMSMNRSVGYLLNLNISGDSISEKTFDFQSNNELFSIDEGIDSGFIITCVSYSENNDTAWSKLIKIKESLDTLWTYTINPSDTAYYIIRQARSYYGSLIVCGGGFHRFSDGFESSFFCNLSQQGSFNWSYTLGQNYPNYIEKLKIAKNNAFFSLGTAYYYGYYDISLWMDNSGSYNYNIYGDIDIFPDYASDFCFTKDSCLAVLGSTQAFNTIQQSNMKMLLIKTDTQYKYTFGDYAHFTAIDNQNKPFITAKIYPNPTQSELFIDYPSNFPFNFDMFSLDGHLILSGKAYESVQINTDGLENGMYIIRIFDQKNSQSLPLIISK